MRAPRDFAPHRPALPTVAWTQTLKEHVILDAVTGAVLAAADARFRSARVIGTLKGKHSRRFR